MRLDSTNKELSEAIVCEGAGDAHKCYQCGRCMSVCPWFLVPNVEYIVYRMPQSVRLGIVTSSEEAEKIAKEVEEFFRCTCCEGCKSECPHGVDIPEIIRAVRKILVSYNAIPGELRAVISRVQSFGNPLGEPKEKRCDWMKDTQAEVFREDMEYAYFSCCNTSYDERLKRVAGASVELLRRGKVSFGVFADEEQCCCGESIRRAGADDVFKQLAGTNINLMKNAGVKKVITVSPHCFTVFRREYTKMGADFEIYHQVQVFHQLIKEGKLKPAKHIDKRIVYHDPCTLARQSSIYDEPRELIQSMPGAKLMEVPVFSRKWGVCCGGGGGGIWLDRPVDERMSDLRVKQVIDAGAEVLAVSCPYCIQMFEDSVKRLNVELVVKDVSELLLESLD